MKKVFLFSIVLTTIFVSCKKDEDDKKGHTYKGPAVQVYSGKAWTWVQVNKKENPEKIAIAIDDAALNSLPIGIAPHNSQNDWILKFNPAATFPPFNHVGLDWNPSGHEPTMIYDKPHFDFHFYMVSEASVAAIPIYEMAKAKFDNWPAPVYFPPNYINPGGGVPMMGTHWSDVTSPEFHGQPFTQTFIFGSYDGRVTFYEPMITLAFLKTTNSFERAIPQPAKFQRDGWYPRKLSVSKKDGTTEIIFSDFVYRIHL